MRHHFELQVAAFYDLRQARQSQAHRQDPAPVSFTAQAMLTRPYFSRRKE